MDLNPSDRWYTPRMSRHIMLRHIPTLPTGTSGSWDSLITAFSTPPRKTGTGPASMSRLRRLQQASRVRLQNIIKLKNRLGKEYWEQKHLFCNSKFTAEPGCCQFMMYDIMKEISSHWTFNCTQAGHIQICLYWTMRGISKSVVQYYI